MTTDNTRALLEQALEVIVGKGDLEAAIRAELAKPPTPAWHDAPTCAGLWVRNRHEGIGVYSISKPSINILKGSAARWYGPIPQDAATTKAEGRKE